MKMRKIISFVLVLALVLGSFSMAFAATPADVVGTPNQEAVEVLMGLGVVDGYEDGSYKPENIVTRAEMAKLIVVALGLADYATGTSKYPDMAGATWAQGYVNYATGLGVIEGYPDGTFKPSQTVSYDEACAMIVRALGYTDASLLPAMWPANYVVKAKALGILDDVKSSALGANRGDIAQMLYNALKVKMVTVDADNKITVTEDDNMLIRLGAVENPAAVIYGTEDTLINLVSYTGTYAVTYTNSDDEIVAVDVSSDSITGDYISTSAIINASTADDTDYNVTSTVAANLVPFFWNGVQEPANAYHASYAIDSTTSATGDNTFAVDLSGKRITTSYAISYWAVTSSDLFTADDADSITDDESLFGNDFILDDNDDIDLNQFKLLGAATLADIDVDDVVYVYNGYDDAGIKQIAVGTEEITGKVTEQDGDDYTIDGKVYNLAYGNVADGHGGIADPGTFAVGDTITARLDFFGNIFDFEIDSTTPDTYAIVKAIDTTDPINDDRVKLYTSDDATKTFNVDEDYNLSTSGITTNDLIGYGLDKDGVIDSFDKTAKDATTASFISAKILKVNNTSTYAVASDVVVFTIDNAGEYDLVNIADVETGVNVAASNTQYILDEDMYVVAVLIDSELAGTTDNGYYAVFNTQSVAIDADDEAIQKLTGFVDGVAATKYTDDEGVIAISLGAIQVWNLDLDGAGIITGATTAGIILGVQNATITDMNSDKSAVQTSAGWSAIADGAVVYVAEMTDGEYEYTLSTISALRDGYKISLFDTIDDEDGYETVVFVK